MPTFTQTAFNAELAEARASAIGDAATLLDALSRAGQSPAVVAAALEGMHDEASRAAVEAREAANAEAKAAEARKAEPKATRRSRAGSAPAGEPGPAAPDPDAL